MVEVRAAEIKLSRHRNLSPGVPHGIAKLSANGLWLSVWRPMRGE